MSNVTPARLKEFEQLDKIITKWKDQPGGLLPIMQGAQEICGCVDEGVEQHISVKTGIPMTAIYGVATFYSQFTLTPRGKYTIGNCMGTACYVRGSQAVLEKIKSELNIEVGETTPDGLFTLEPTRCIGCCGLAPAMMINDQVFGRLTADQIPGILDSFRKKG